MNCAILGKLVVGVWRLILSCREFTDSNVRVDWIVVQLANKQSTLAVGSVSGRVLHGRCWYTLDTSNGQGMDHWE
jgi:hypothetical protein